MRWTQFSLPGTDTYVRRVCVWVPGGSLPADGFVTISCVKRNGLVDGPTTYGVQRNGLRVTVWKLGGRVTQKPYVVTVGAEYQCSCRARAGCKHKDAAAELIRRGLI